MGLGASFPVSSAAGRQVAGGSAVCGHQGAAGAQLWVSACGLPAREEVAGLVWQVAQGPLRPCLSPTPCLGCWGREGLGTLSCEPLLCAALTHQGLLGLLLTLTWS